MIKRVLGIGVAVLAMVVIVVAVIHRGKYASLVFDEPEASAVFEATAEEGSSAGSEPRYDPAGEGAMVSPVSAAAPDSVEFADSLRMETGAE